MPTPHGPPTWAPLDGLDGMLQTEDGTRMDSTADGATDTTDGRTDTAGTTVGITDLTAPTVDGMELADMVILREVTTSKR